MKKLLFLLLALPLLGLAVSCDDDDNLPKVDITFSYTNGTVVGSQVYVVKPDTLYIDGKPTQHCFFTKDYYWMASNNSVNLSDSRLFGFVPQDHIIGKASLIWFSKEKGTGIFDGYRWNRFFQSVK